MTNRFRWFTIWGRSFFPEINRLVADHEVIVDIRECTRDVDDGRDPPWESGFLITVDTRTPQAQKAEKRWPFRFLG